MSSQAKTYNLDPEKEFLQMVSQFNATSLEEAIVADTNERLEIGVEMLMFCNQHVVDLMTIHKEHQKCTSKLANEITSIQNHHLNELASKVLSNGFDGNWHAHQMALLKRQLEEINAESDKYENEYFSMTEESTNLENKAKGIEAKIVQEKKRIREERANKRAEAEMKRIEEEAERKRQEQAEWKRKEEETERKRLEEKEAERMRNEEEEAQRKHKEQETKRKEEAQLKRQKEDEAERKLKEKEAARKRKEEETERKRKEKEAERERQKESRKRRRSDSEKEKRAEELKTPKKEPSNPGHTFPKTPYKKMAIADSPIRPPS